MEHLVETIQHKLREKFVGRTVSLIPEIDSISFTALYRVVFEGRVTKYTFQSHVLSASAKQSGLNVDQVAEQWVSSVHGLEQMLLQNEIKL